MTPQTERTPSLSSPAEETPTREQIAVVRVIYRLWRVDTAARAFPYDMETELSLMRARWSIGLVQELVCGFLLSIVSAYLSLDPSKVSAMPWGMRASWVI